MAEIQNFSRKRPDSSTGFIGSLISKAYSNLLGNTYLPFSFKKVPSLYLIINAVLNFKTVLSTKFPRVCILKYKSVSGLCYAPFVYVLALIWLCWKEFFVFKFESFYRQPLHPCHPPTFLLKIVLIFLYIYSFKGSGFSVCQSSRLFIRFSFVFKERLMTISTFLSQNIFIYLELVLYSSIHLKNFVWGCRLLNLFMGIYFAINRIFFFFFLLYLLIRFFRSE